MKYFVVDAFTDTVFRGNPAGVCLLEHPLDHTLMQSIAAENNLAETAFVSPAPDGGFDLRWFTPTVEVDLCGHATLASAFVLRQVTSTVEKFPQNRPKGPILSEFLDSERRDATDGLFDVRNGVQFHTKSGTLTVTFDGDLYCMDFPSRPPTPIQLAPEYAAAVGCEVVEAHLSRDLLLVAPDEAAVRAATPDFDALAALPLGFGVILTAVASTVPTEADGVATQQSECVAAEQADFVSRFFVPKGGVDEDPVTGSSHSTLIPFWASRLGKSTLVARQISTRGGTLYCEQRGDRVGIAGRAVLYLSGEIHQNR